MLKKILLFKKQIEIKYVIFILFQFLFFYKSLYNSIINSIQTGSWRLFLIPFAIIILKEESKNTQKISKDKVRFVLYLVTICTALFLQYLGRWASLNIFYEFSIILAIISSLILFTGIKGIVKYKWTLFYLLFMTSVTDEFVLPLQFFLRTVATNAVAFIMPLLGYPIITDGTNIRLSYIVMNIAAECSGLNQFMSLLIIAIPLSIMLIKNSFLRIAAIICSFPLAIFSNVLRLIIIGVWNYNRSEFSHGPHGLFAMSSIFLMGLILQYILTLLFSIYESRYLKKVNDYRKDTIGNIISLEFKGILIIIGLTFLGWIFLLINTPEKNVEHDLTIKNYQISGWNEIEGYEKVFLDYNLPSRYRIKKMFIDSDSNVVLIEENHYPYQDSEKNLELTTYPVLRFLYDSKIRTEEGKKSFNYSFGYKAIQDNAINKNATAVLYRVNKKITGSRTLAKIEVIKRLMFSRKNSGSLIAITLINKGSKGRNDFLILEDFISALIR